MSVPEGNGGAAVERRPLGAVVASAVQGFRRLARQHLELAKIEVAEAASVRGKGVGMMAAAVVVVMFAFWLRGRNQSSRPA